MLTGRKGLAKVSSTPGKTSLINFFTINKTWSLVDLPGYGYAKVSKKERGRFSSAIGQYLQYRPNLAGTFVLIDSLISPQKIDLEFLHWMVGSGLPFALVFTKVDRQSATAAAKKVEAFLECFREISKERPDVLLTSSKARTGRAEMLAVIEEALGEASDEGRGPSGIAQRESPS